MTIKALDLHSVAIIASFWLENHSKKFFADEINAVERIRHFCSSIEDNDEEILIDRMPF